MRKLGGEGRARARCARGWRRRAERARRGQAGCSRRRRQQVRPVPAAARRPSAAGPEPRAAANFVRAARQVAELRSATGPGGGRGDGRRFSLPGSSSPPVSRSREVYARAGWAMGQAEQEAGRVCLPQSFHGAGLGARAPGGRRWWRGVPGPGALPTGGAVARDGRAARGSEPGRSRRGRGVWLEMGNNESEQLEEVVVKESWEMLRGQLSRAL